MTFPKKIRFFFHLIIAVVKKQYRIIFLGLILGISAFFILPKIYSRLPKPNKTVKIGFVGQYLINNIPLSILQEISYGLTTVSEKGEPLPALAEKWSVLDEGKTYVFKVNTGKIFWHDKKEFSPLDINYNFNDIEFSANGDSLVFKLKEPFSPLPVVLSKPLFRKGLIGLGKYKVKKIKSSGKFINSILLVPNNEPSLTDRLYRFYNNENDLKIAFNLGEVNTIKDIFNLDGLFLGSLAKVTPTIITNAYIGLFFNTTNPPFSNKSFRQALAYAIPKESGGKRVLTPLNPASWVYNPDVKPYNQDFQHSNKLLENEVIDKNLKINILSFPQFEDIANQVRDSWKQIGINSEVKIISVVPEDFEVLIIAREIPKDPDQYYFWHSTQAGNISNFKNLRLDKLLEDGRRTTNTEERKDIYFDFQRFLVEESPVVFLSHPVVYNISRR